MSSNATAWFNAARGVEGEMRGSILLRVLGFAAVWLGAQVAMAAGVVGSGTPATCTEAVLDAAFNGGGAVTFNCGLNPATITVSNQLVIASNTNIDGAGLVTISGGGTSSIFAVNADVTVTLANLTLSAGFAANGAGVANIGGAIYNGGTLNAVNITFSGNGASGGGGAIANGGTLMVLDSTFAGNQCSIHGGGAIMNGGTAMVVNSTFSGNSGNFGGGAIQNNTGATLLVTNCTFASNSAVARGGAIDNEGGTVTLRNTIIANNSAPMGGNCSGAVEHGSFNLQWPGTDCGTDIRSVDPQLAPSGLADNGGPTQTIALQAGSPAIDDGDYSVCAGCPENNLDQRGFVRPGTGYTTCCIGAYEFGSPGTPTPTTSPTQTSLPTPTVTPLPTMPSRPCVGDCNGSGEVTVNELLTLVNVALGNAPPTACEHGTPSGTEVDISLIIQAVNNALNGCPMVSG